MVETLPFNRAHTVQKSRYMRRSEVYAVDEINAAVDLAASASCMTFMLDARRNGLQHASPGTTARASMLVSTSVSHDRHSVFGACPSEDPNTSHLHVARARGGKAARMAG